MIDNILTPFIDYIKNGEFINNEFAVAGILSALAYSLLNILKPLPLKIWDRIIRLFRYQLTLEQSDLLYARVSRMIEDQYPRKLRNTTAFLEEHYGDSYRKKDITKTEILVRHLTDYFHIFKNSRLIKVNFGRDNLENADNFEHKYMGNIKISGLFAKKAIHDWLDESAEYKMVAGKGEVVKFTYQYNWEKTLHPTNKSVDTIFFPEKDRILKKVDRFNENKELYHKRGIEWYLGCLFYGKAGSGKSSFGAALAEYTKRDLYTLNLSGLDNAEFIKAFNSIGSNALLLLDDVDIGLAVRDNSGKTTVSLGTLLSCLDGSLSRSDLIVVMTTNDISKLDPALIRKGRMDIHEEISYPDLEGVVNYLKNFYNVPENVGIYVKDREFNESVVNIQDICLNNDLKTALEIINHEQ